MKQYLLFVGWTYDPIFSYNYIHPVIVHFCWYVIKHLLFICKSYGADAFVLWKETIIMTLAKT